MAAARVVFHPGASDDYAAAFAWYYTRGTALASDFEREIERGIRLISQNPLRWPKFDGQRRRFVARKFPYADLRVKRARKKVRSARANRHEAFQICMPAGSSRLPLHLPGDVTQDSGSPSDASLGGKIHRLATVPLGATVIGIRTEFKDLYWATMFCTERDFVSRGIGAAN